MAVFNLDVFGLISLGLGIIGLAFSLEKAISLIFRVRLNSEELLLELKHLLSEHKLVEAVDKIQTRKLNPLARVIEVGLLKSAKGIREIQLGVEGELLIQDHMMATRAYLARAFGSLSLAFGSLGAVLLALQASDRIQFQWSQILPPLAIGIISFIAITGILAIVQERLRALQFELHYATKVLNSTFIAYKNSTLDVEHPELRQSATQAILVSSFRDENEAKAKERLAEAFEQVTREASGVDLP